MNALLKLIAWSFYTKNGSFCLFCLAVLTWVSLEYTGHFVAAVIVGPVLMFITFLRLAYLGNPEGFNRSFGVTESPSTSTDNKETSDHE